MTPDEVEMAHKIIIQPEFWCRARLFWALQAAARSGKLKEVMDEIELPDEAQAQIMQHLLNHWGAI